ncbi:MAG: Fic family protein [Bacteroidia bacterium]|nr:Fic family protein [Bacteroidia bacterium]
MTRDALDALLQALDAQKAELDRLRPLKPDIEARVQQYLRIDWDYHSNAIEGNSLTLGETRNLILNGLTAHGKPLRDHQEIKNHDEIVQWLEAFVRDEPEVELTQHLVRELHQRLLGEPYWVPAQTPEGAPTQKQIVPGRYKQAPNHVRTPTGEIHYYAAPEDVQPRMNELFEWLASGSATLHPVERAALFHYRFVAIHPFDDGNGRMSRILMNLLLMRAGFVPAVVTKAQRPSYIEALEEADQTGSTDAFVGVIAAAAQRSLDIYLKAARGEEYRVVE